MRRVCQVARELPVRALMALATGLDNIVSAEHRIGIGRRKDAVRTMAVVTLGDALTAQARNLAVEGIEECLSLVRVTASTLLHHQGAESQPLDPHDRMRGVTILAGRVIVLGYWVFSPVNTALELFRDPMVTSTAGTGNVRRVNRGVRVSRSHLGMRTVAIRTGRRYDKATFNETATVNTVFIATDNVIDVSVYPRCGFLAHAMASSTLRRHIQRIRR